MAILAFAMGLWLGPLNVRFRDVKMLLPFITQVWMYASPIIYPLSLIPPEWRSLYCLNPMVGIIESFRWAAFGHSGLDAGTLAISVTATLALAITGLYFFKHMERSFADNI